VKWYQLHLSTLLALMLLAAGLVWLNASERAASNDNWTIKIDVGNLAPLLPPPDVPSPVYDPRSLRIFSPILFHSFTAEAGRLYLKCGTTTR
jgi:hypothetical protein